MARIREISGLRWAEWADPPSFVGTDKHRLSPQQRAGLAYEKKFGQHLSRAPMPSDALLLRGPWIAFEDAGGPGLAQPDFLLISPRGAYIFECKLRENTKAWIQLTRLYLPLIAHILSRHNSGPAGQRTAGPSPGAIRRVQVCKHLRPLASGVAKPRNPIIHRAKDLQDECIWNWTGRGAS